MPSARHETAHTYFGMVLVERFVLMGLSNSICPAGATRYQGNTSSKEGDTAYRPFPARGLDDWPTIVIEAGVSESLSRLRVDANWWLINSGGDVRIVVIISLRVVQLALQSIQIEKWELAPPPPRPQTRSVTNSPVADVPTKIQEITIEPNTVTGAPLVLEFQKVFLRQAIPPEADFSFSAQDLQNYAADLW